MKDFVKMLVFEKAPREWVAPLIINCLTGISLTEA
jgi:hypothetical protein